MKWIFGGLFQVAVLILALWIVPGNVNAQLCQGSLGDPLVNITFGSGLNPGPALAAATTSYQYVPNDCPNDGFYTVRNNTNTCFSNSWHSLSSDHTGSPGYFMLVNASFQPSAFYLDTVRNLCSGTTYEFAAWIMNVLLPSACNSNGIRPNLTFTIEKTDGTVLQTYNTNDIPMQSAPTWQQYGFFFATPSNVSDIVLRIFNNSQGGCGNDLALDDITFRPCGPQLTSSINGSASSSISTCEGTAQSYSFTCAVSAGFNNPSFQWQQNINGAGWTDIPGATTTAMTQNFPANATPGTYSYRLSAAEAGNMAVVKCRVASQPITITIEANPVTTASANSPLCERNTLVLTATGGQQYNWNGVNGFSGTGSPVSIENVQAVQSGKYYVTVTNTAGCTHLDSVIVTINANPVASTSFSETFICEGDNISLSASGGITYKWEPATGLSSATTPDPVASPADTTNYRVIVTNQFGCNDTAEVKINVVEKPRASAGPDKTIIMGNSVQLNGTATGQDISYTWTPNVFIDDPLKLQPLVTPPHDTSYVLTVVSNQGCETAIDTVHVFVFRDVYIPTAFSPNGNGLNDTWFIPALSAYTEFRVSVYNRYGELIFQTVNNNKPWDGKYKGIPQASGAYVYMVDIRDTGRLLKGTVMIVR
jgi:gliding motility-associated-like protein